MKHIFSILEGPKILFYFLHLFKWDKWYETLFKDCLN